jgi:hypothetical protein
MCYLQAVETVYNQVEKKQCKSEESYYQLN